MPRAVRERVRVGAYSACTSVWLCVGAPPSWSTREGSLPRPGRQYWGISIQPLPPSRRQQPPVWCKLGTITLTQPITLLHPLIYMCRKLSHIIGEFQYQLQLNIICFNIRKIFDSKKIALQNNPIVCKHNLKCLDISTWFVYFITFIKLYRQCYSTVLFSTISSNNGIIVFFFYNCSLVNSKFTPIDPSAFLSTY